MSEVATIRPIQSDEDVSSPTPRPRDVEFARVMWRLKMVSCKLDLAATHWKVPDEVDGDDLGAVMTVLEVTRELDGLYCAFADLVREHDLWSGPWVDSFDEGAPEPAFQG